MVMRGLITMLRNLEFTLRVEKPIIKVECYSNSAVPQYKIKI